MAVRTSVVAGLSGLVVAALFLGLAGEPAATGAAIPVVTTSSGLTSQVITIDGVEVEVVIQVVRQDVAASPQARPQTSVSVTLRTLDGSNLPAKLNAEVVKLDRAKAPSRVFRETLYSVQTFRFDPTSAGYSAIGNPAYALGAKLKATIRLRTSTGVRYVRFGSVRVDG